MLLLGRLWVYINQHYLCTSCPDRHDLCYECARRPRARPGWFCWQGSAKSGADCTVFGQQLIVMSDQAASGLASFK
jgi:hypothetical protein